MLPYILLVTPSFWSDPKDTSSCVIRPPSYLRLTGGLWVPKYPTVTCTIKSLFLWPEFNTCTSYTLLLYAHTHYELVPMLVQTLWPRAYPDSERACNSYSLQWKHKNTNVHLLNKLYSGVSENKTFIWHFWEISQSKPLHNELHVIQGTDEGWRLGDWV